MNRINQYRKVSLLPNFDQDRAFTAFFRNTKVVAFDCFQPAGDDATDPIIAAIVIAEADN
jgi:hypothetical protein